MQSLILIFMPFIYFLHQTIHTVYMIDHNTYIILRKTLLNMTILVHSSDLDMAESCNNSSDKDGTRPTFGNR